MADIQVKVGDDSAPVVTIHVSPTSTLRGLNGDGPADDVASTTITNTENEGENVVESSEQTAEPVVDEGKDDVDKVLNGSKEETGEMTGEAKKDVNEVLGIKTESATKGGDHGLKPMEEPVESSPAADVNDSTTEKQAPQESAPAEDAVSQNAALDDSAAQGEAQQEPAQEEPAPRRASVFREVEVQDTEDGKTTVAITEPPSADLESSPKRTLTTVEIESVPADDTTTLNGGAPSTTSKKTVTVRFEDSVQQPPTPKKKRNRVADSVRGRYPDFLVKALVGRALQPEVSQKLKEKVGKNAKAAKDAQSDEAAQPDQAAPIDQFTQADQSTQAEQTAQSTGSEQTQQQQPRANEELETPANGTAAAS